MLHEFTSANTLQQKIDAYFIFIQGEYHLEAIPAKNAKTEGETIQQKVWDREAMPATFTEFAFFLGFACRKDFDAYLNTGRFAETLKRGRLRVEAEYEKRLHQQSPTGAIFVLKNQGWDERITDAADKDSLITTLQIEVLNTPFLPCHNEADVDINI